MKLSDFKDEQAVALIAKLLPPIGRIAANAKTAAVKNNMMELASAMLENSPKEVLQICAILDGKDPEEYHTDAANMLFSVIDMFNDPALMRLFGLQGKTPASSRSASGNTGGRTAQKASSDTAKQELIEKLETAFSAST